MRNLNIVPDVGAPLTVVAVDLIAESYAPTWTKWIDGLMTVGGYLGAYFGFGGAFVKNIGIASMPITARNIYDYARGGAATSKRLAFRPKSAAVSRYPAPAPSSPFQGVKLD